MSFGKDDQRLNAIPVYGGSTTQRAASAGRKKKRNYGNKRPYWADTFKPSETQISMVRLIPGEYVSTKVNEHDQLVTETLPWLEFIEHYSGRVKRGGICSGGPWFFRKDRRDPCLGCDTRDSESKNNRSMSRSDKFAFVVIDMGLFHQVYQLDHKSGQVRTNKDGQPYLEWVKCSQRGCQNCQTAVQSRYGYVQPWTMPKAHFNALNAYAPGIGSCCVTCRGRGTVQSIGWLCGNPQCQTTVFDMRTTTATDEQIGEVVNDPFACQTCHQTTYPNEVISCTNCTPNGWQPRRATIFDMDLQVQAPRTGENDASNLQVVGMSDPKPLDPQFEDLLQYKPDLAKRFSPDSLEHQAELWQVSIGPAQVGGPRPGAYGQPGAMPPAAQYAAPYGTAPVQQPMVQQPMTRQPQPQPQPQLQPQPQPAPQPQPQLQPAPQPAPQFQQPPTQQPQPPQFQQPPHMQPPTAPQGGYMPPPGGYTRQ